MSEADKCFGLHSCWAAYSVRVSVYGSNLFFKVLYSHEMYLNENAPSAGTETIDHISKCHSGLWEAVTSSSKTDVLVILAS